MVKESEINELKKQGKKNVIYHVRRILNYFLINIVLILGDPGVGKTSLVYS